jgi:hypothetical protein
MVVKDVDVLLETGRKDQKRKHSWCDCLTF